MINCGDPKKVFVEYRCTYCGKDSRIIGFNYKSSLCLKCGAIRAYDFVEEVMAKLHYGAVYRHLTLTISEQLRSLFYKNRHSKDLYNRFYKIGWECLCNRNI
ncbi:MAG: transposase zinc-binding domain-containing protein [Oligoflexia bacterium]|nr:transposase zinc-binding domain-containing protein [Oligoflexia bacterium]